MKTSTKALALAAASLLAIGCSASPPPELIDARAAFNRASKSPNAALTPTVIHEARVDLDRAERQFKEEGDEQSTRDLAYIAQRTSVSAQAIGNTAQALRAKEQAIAQLEQARAARAVATRGELEQTKEQLGEAQQRAQSERQARAAADQRAQEALAKIEGLKTEQSDRGLVLTLSGAVLFETAKSVIRPTAEKRLEEVAAALKADGRPVLVVGHTDAQGAEEYNTRLSEQRAAAVKNFLVRHGISPDMIRTEGMGETQPIADNSSPEGRANNRRVELILGDSGKLGDTGNR